MKTREKNDRNVRLLAKLKFLLAYASKAFTHFAIFLRKTLIRSLPAFYGFAEIFNYARSLM